MTTAKGILQLEKNGLLLVKNWKDWLPGILYRAKKMEAKSTRGEGGGVFLLEEGLIECRID